MSCIYLYRKLSKLFLIERNIKETGKTIYELDIWVSSFESFKSYCD